MTARKQDAMQLRKRLDGRSRRTQTQVRTRSRVQHPAGHDDDDARCHLNVYDLTGGSVLAVLAPYSAAIQRMPAVEDLDFLPDMGRMNGQLCSIVRMRYSPATSAVRT